MSFKNVTAILGAVLCAATLNAQTVILDNTADGTATLSTILGTITAVNQNAKVFTTPAFNSNLSSVKLSLYSNNIAGSPTATINMSLYLVDADTTPTGTALATQSFQMTNLSSTPAYYDFDITDANWPLAASTTYALVINGTTTSGNISWTSTANNYTTTNGYTFVVGKRSTNSGSSWAVNAFRNGMQLSVSNIPLAVKLQSFDATTTGNYVNINWVTASESVTQGFEVEKSNDAKTFREVAFVNAANNQEGKSYQQQDLFESGYVFYRLKTINTDGTFVYSNTVKVSDPNATNQSVQVFPNPTANNVTVTLNKSISNAHLQLRDLNGKIIQNILLKEGQQLQTISLNGLPAGNYILFVTGANNYHQSLLVSKL